MYVYIYMMLNDHMMLPACQRQTEALGPLASELSTRRTPPFQVDARALPGLKGSGGEETTALEFMDARRTALLFWQRALSRGGGGEGVRGQGQARNCDRLAAKSPASQPGNLSTRLSSNSAALGKNS